MYLIFRVWFKGIIVVNIRRWIYEWLECRDVEYFYRDLFGVLKLIKIIKYNWKLRMVDGLCVLIMYGF